MQKDYDLKQTPEMIEEGGEMEALAGKGRVCDYFYYQYFSLITIRYRAWGREFVLKASWKIQVLKHQKEIREVEIYIGIRDRKGKGQSHCREEKTL